jgi:hypothetical protein
VRITDDPGELTFENGVQFFDDLGLIFHIEYSF